MSYALKNVYNPEFVATLAQHIKAVYPVFKSKQFQQLVIPDLAAWEALELKPRMRHIVNCLGETLPSNYQAALKIMHKIAPHFKGLPAFLFGDFVAVYGQAPDDWDASIAALGYFTQFSTSEFGIRPFLKAQPKRIFKQFLKWTSSSDHHQRRLASEGCRPRLPWGEGLVFLKKDPSPILPILEKLKTDDSDYVRKSVANNLNDISKDHPELVLEIAQKWLGTHPHTNWIVKHACRGLLKSAHPKALQLFGFGEVGKITIQQLNLAQAKIKIGDALHFSFDLENGNAQDCKLRIEYGIDYVKSNGKTSRKIFKITENNYLAQERITFKRKQALHDMTTRKHYPGQHTLAIIINGQELANIPFDLVR